MAEHVKAVDDKGRPLVADPRRQEDAVKHLKAHFQYKAVKDITIEDCEEYLRKRRAGEIGGTRRGKKIIPGKDGTVRRELVVLTAAIENAAKRKRILRTDVPFIKKPEDSPAKERWLTHEELGALRAAATGELRDFIDVGYYTASRRGAIERLTVFQIDLDHDRITLAIEGERETKKRRPVIRMAPEIKPVLRRLVEKAKEEKRTRLFKTVSFYRPFIKLCDDLKLADVTPHTLRHTRATHLLQQGKTIWDVAGLLGDTVATVERVYGHHATDYQGSLEAKDKDPSKIEDMLK